MQVEVTCADRSLLCLWCSQVDRPTCKTCNSQVQYAFHVIWMLLGIVQVIHSDHDLPCHWCYCAWLSSRLYCTLVWRNDRCECDDYVSNAQIVLCHCN